MNVEFIPLQKHGDERGMLVALEQAKNIPFEIKRVYYMFGTQGNVRRGYHAHKKIRQVAIPLNGSCRFHLDNGREKIDVVLDDPALGLLIEPGVWHEMYDYSKNCILLVLASDIYDENDYIRNHEDFMRSVKNDS
ncbi:WxcM-like domain-containing protein [Escherichia coli]|uniref:sugar 3,4-ketoisomerase n=1 Tax=Escherichia coli TaxID=562 RepID=UPI00169EF3B1|nr:WxcM-like domain-containing protein [Escherichia coli]EHH7004923.1 WxcM-like domain-containing protein [Escherichia coli]EHH7147549.1 WxcM-like domain-containing protein [Escherichia coli]EHN6392612.1 WxcM-like domain-containing protein [Escherichia coli]EJE3143425.1 WxcM-like domain-containing protein [Escherichia coli]